MQAGTFQPFKVSAQLLATPPTRLGKGLKRRNTGRGMMEGAPGRKVGSSFSFKGVASQADSRLLSHRGRG